MTEQHHPLAKVAKEFGSEVAGSIMFALSPVHTDEYYADKAEKLSASPDIDTLLLYDTAGVLDKERLKTLVPAINAKARGKPIEFHANNILGQSAKAYLDAIGTVTARRDALAGRMKAVLDGAAFLHRPIDPRTPRLIAIAHELETSLGTAD